MLSNGLLTTRLQHEKYQMNLPQWDQFIIWSYTVGSSTINNYLLGNDISTNLIYWTARIFQTYQQISNKPVPVKYNRWSQYFNGKKSISVKDDYIPLIKLFTLDLQRIILNSPVCKSDIILYKSSSPYSGLDVGVVPQSAFNSTSYKADMNFSMFLPSDGMCCMHKIILLKGSNALILSPHLSAYPYECEVILPYDINFNVHVITSTILHVPTSSPNITWKPIQKSPITLGPMYDYNYKIECNTTPKNVKTFISTVHT